MPAWGVDVLRWCRSKLTARYRKDARGDAVVMSPTSTMITIAGRDAPYVVRVSRRSRRAELHIHPRRGLEVVLPAGAPSEAAAELLQAKADWLTKNAVHIHRAARSRVAMRNGSSLPFLGEWLELRVDEGGRRGVRLEGARLHVRPGHDGEEEVVRRSLEAWYRKQARRRILSRVDVLRTPEDASIRRLSIRDQDTRWGSCSSARSLSFNWRLVMAPPDVLDSVVVHELVHLRVLDHSPRFWRALDARFPRHRACRRWLDANAYRLGF